MPWTTTVTGRYLWGDGVAVLQPPCAERADLASEAPPAQRVRVDRCAGGKTEPECGMARWGGCSKVAEGAMVLAVGERIAVGLSWARWENEKRNRSPIWVECRIERPPFFYGAKRPI